jgi:hypothetical protein
MAVNVSLGFSWDRQSVLAGNRPSSKPITGARRRTVIICFLVL